MNIEAENNLNEKAPPSTQWWLVLLCCLCVLYGFHSRYMAVTRTVVDHPIRADAADYFMYAWNLKHWSVYSRSHISDSTPKPDALRSPGFPMFASLFMTNNPDSSLKHVIIAQTLLQVLSFLLLTYVFIRLLGWAWAFPALLLLWTFPQFISIDTYFLSESLFVSCLALLVFFAWHFRQRDFLTDAGAVLCGLILGFASLVRPGLDYFPYFFLVVVFLFRRRGRQYWLLAVIAVIPVLAWKVRNLMAIGATSDPTLMINALYHGSFPNFMYQNNPASFGIPYRFDPHASEVYKGVGATLHLIWERFLGHPLEYLRWYLVGKQTFLWQWGIVAGQGDIFIYPTPVSPYYFMPDMKFMHAFNKAVHGVWVIAGLLAPFVIGYRYWKRPDSGNVVWILMALLVTYTVLIHAIVAPFPRYGIPFKLLLIPMSIYVVREFLLWIKLKTTKQSQ